MARIRYQPATKTKGFQPIQLTTAGISRMREETNRVVQGMEKNLQAEQEQQKKNLQAMQDNAAYTEKRIKENRDIEVQNLKNEELSITQTADRDAQQAKYDADATQTILTSIQDFSKTAAKKAAANTAKQLEDQTDAAMAVDISSLRFKDGGKYEESFDQFGLSAPLEGTAALTEGAESGEDLDVTFDRLAANAGLGAIGRRILANRVYGEAHRVFTDRAFGSDEKKYELNGKKFSGADSRNSGDQTAVVQSYVTNEVTRYMRKSFGVTDGLYFTDGKTKAEEENELERNRSRERGVEFKKQVMLDDSNVLLSSYNKTNSGLAYGHIVKATNSYKTANTAMVNAIKMASTKEEAQAIRDAVIIGQNGKATTWGQRYSQSADEAERDRVQRIDSDNNKARLAQERGVKERTLAAFNDGQIPAMIAENPFAAEKRLKDLFASVGEPIPTYLSKELGESQSLYNADELVRIKSSGAIPSDERINAANGTHQTALKELKKEAELRKFGGEAGKDALAAQTGTAKGIYKLSVEGPNSAGSALLAGVLEAEWKKIWKDKGFGYATDADTIGKQVQIVNEALKTKLKEERTDPTAKFHIPDVADRNDIVLPNLFPDYKDYQQMKTLVDKKFAAGRSIGEIASTPSLLATPAELTALSQKSETSSDLRYPPLIMYAVAKMKGKFKPSEIANESIAANNLAFGENTPLIQPNIKSQAMDEASPADAKLMNSLSRAQNNRGFANHAQQLSTPGQGPLDLHMRTSTNVGTNTGIIITSANDASGEPGSDFVINNGQRGARFYFPFKSKVVAIDRDSNWETNLSSNPNGQRGFGNVNC